MTFNKVLVTGSKGFVGKHLCKFLKQSGFQIVTTHNKHRPIDVTNTDQLLKIDDVNAIVHVAGKTPISDSFKKPFETYFTNFIGILNVLVLARKRKIKKVIYVSTYVYG